MERTRFRFSLAPILSHLLDRIKNLFLPRPMQRDAAQQQAVDAQTAQLLLYHFPSCPYCLKVRWHIHKLNLSIELRDAQRPQHHQALLQGGGMGQVPCLRIQKNPQQVEWLYESDAIIRRLQQTFGVQS